MSDLRTSVVVSAATMMVTADASLALVTHPLGACLAIAIYDPLTRVAGLLHAMLPDSATDPAKAEETPAMFVDTGLPAMLQTATDQGADLSHVVLKVVGGAALLDDAAPFAIGRRNYESLLKAISHYNLRISAEKVGDQVSRSARLDVETGILTVVTPGEEDLTI
ncbi:MAG: chemotaxis protein CheD [Verrucomicrobia bacterium]|nr:chemotaxis protein CheD [Verrucomicrobiota bacterium]